jgi:small subunit ribosomal protein S14
MSTRQAVASSELLRRAYKYLARNTTLPSRTRHQAQLGLNALLPKTRPDRVKERCIETGRGRGIITEFGLCRVSARGQAGGGQGQSGDGGAGQGSGTAADDSTVHGAALEGFDVQPCAARGGTVHPARQTRAGLTLRHVR